MVQRVTKQCFVKLNVCLRNRLVTLHASDHSCFGVVHDFLCSRNPLLTSHVSDRSRCGAVRILISLNHLVTFCVSDGSHCGAMLNLAESLDAGEEVLC